MLPGLARLPRLTRVAWLRKLTRLPRRLPITASGSTARWGPTRRVAAWIAWTLWGSSACHSPNLSELTREFYRLLTRDGPRTSSTEKDPQKDSCLSISAAAQW